MTRPFRAALALLLAGCAARGAGAPLSPVVRSLAAELDSAFAGPEFARAQWGVVVRSLDNGQVLYRRNADRLFIHLRDTDFTTAVFRGAQPLFIRSRNLSAERTVDQEIRLSANYLRDSLQIETFASCWVAGERGADVHGVLAEEFRTQVRTIALKDYAEDLPAGVYGLDAELTACTGVFTG